MSDSSIRPSLKLVKLGYVLAVVLVAATYGAQRYYKKPEPPWLPAVPAVLLLWPLKHHLSRGFTTLTTMGDKLRYETGMLSKTTRTIQLTKVQDVRVDQSLGQRMLGLGNLTIETAGETSKLTIEDIDHPQAVADRIMESAQRGTGHGL